MLDMLRGVLALAVAVYHFFVIARPFTGHARDLLVIAGIYAVQTFFMISGFCFFHLYAAAPLTWSIWSRFHIKRFFRIAPLYYAAVGLSLLSVSPVYPDFRPIRLLENLSLSFGFFHPNHALVHGGWSIGIEYVFYVALPLLVWLTRRRAALYGVTLVLMALAIPYTFDKVAAASETQRFHMYVAIPNHAFLFLLGGVIADLRKQWQVRLPAATALLPLAAFGLAVVYLQPTFYDHLDVMVGFARAKYVLLSFVVVLTCALLKPPTTSLAWQPLRILGDWSYSVYLVHPLAWVIAQRLAPTETPSGVLLLLAVGLTLVIAGMAHRWLEKPTNALGHALAKGRSRAPFQHLDVITDTQRAEPSVH